MKTAIIYTVLSVLNLIAYVVGISFLPAEVPVHFDFYGTADRMGSPWLYVAFPATVALISGGIWTIIFTQKPENGKAICLCMSIFGAVFAVLGWVFFVLLSSGVGLGEKTDFPFMLAVVLPLSILFAFFGNYMPRIKPNHWVGIRTRATLKSEFVWTKTHRLGGYLLFASGILCAVVSVLFSCVPVLAAVNWVSVVVLLACLTIDTGVILIYSSLLYKKEKQGDTSS